jgi:hypothetical protein
MGCRSFLRCWQHPFPHVKLLQHVPHEAVQHLAIVTST